MGTCAYKPNVDSYVIKLCTTEEWMYCLVLQQLCEIGEQFFGEFQSRKNFFLQTLSSECNWFYRENSSIQNILTLTIKWQLTISDYYMSKVF